MLDLVLDLIPPSYSQGDPCARCAADASPHAVPVGPVPGRRLALTHATEAWPRSTTDRRRDATSASMRSRDDPIPQTNTLDDDGRRKPRFVGRYAACSGESPDSAEG